MFGWLGSRFVVRIGVRDYAGSWWGHWLGFGGRAIGSNWLGLGLVGWRRLFWLWLGLIIRNYNSRRLSRSWRWGVVRWSLFFCLLGGFTWCCWWTVGGASLCRFHVCRQALKGLVELFIVEIGVKVGEERGRKGREVSKPLGKQIIGKTGFSFSLVAGLVRGC